MAKPLTVTLAVIAVFGTLLGFNTLPQDATSESAKRSARTVDKERPHKPLEVGHPTFVSPHASPIAIHNGYVFVVNTPADTVDVIDAKTRKIVHRVGVGIDPVSIAVRPDGKEVWVSNHISDSVSVIDSDSRSPTYLHVIATVQEFDAKSKATRFDEPVGIAFAGSDKAYVALSSENQIAVIDVGTRKVTGRLHITAQDPRAIMVRGDRLYVIPFESNNKTQLSGGNKDDIDGDLVTFDAWNHSIANNNVLSLGHVTDIVKHPDVPDRDLYIFDTKTDKLIETVDTLGTLLYGLTVDSQGKVFIAQTDARNDANGRAGTRKHDLKELENRAFLNQITRVDFQDGAARKPDFINLEPLPPEHPDKENALATPFAIQVSGDDKTLVVSAAGSDKLFTVDAASGDVLGRVDVGAVPRGIALENDAADKPTRAWVFNAVENSVSLVDLARVTEPAVVETIALVDPTHPKVKRGRIAFNTATASTTGTFSCASCHPDGHTDQLLWVLKTPVVTGGNQIMPRSTMPIRGLRDTAPYHWDGIPGDPYGGNNSANIHGSDKPNSNIDDPASTTRHLIDGGLASTMMQVGDETVNDEGQAGELTAAQRDDMATFLLSVPYPPAQRRAYDNVVSSRAQEGFKLFHIDGDNDPTKPRPNVCGNCHRMPFLVSTNTPGTGMDAPTWRGAYDRFLILPQGRLNIIDFDFYERVAQRGQPERDIWQFSWAGRRRFDPVWDMVLEGSTGQCGSFARQVTLNQFTAKDELTHELLSALEVAASEGAVVLQCDGVLIDEAVSQTIVLQFDGVYFETDHERKPFTREELITLASDGKFIGTFTARHGAHADVERPQPAIWTRGPMERQRGRQRFPMLHAGSQSMTVSGRHFRDDASLFVDGRRVSGSVSVGDGEEVVITVSNVPPVGMHLLQLQTPQGLFSNDFIFHVVNDAQAAADLQRRLNEPHVGPRNALARAVARGDLDETKKRLGDLSNINDRRGDDGSTLLSTAALHGRYEIAKYLIESGAKVDAANNDGNTPLHVAAFLCRKEIVQLLLEKGGSVSQKNNRNETPIDVVSGEWSDGLAGFYTAIGDAVGIELILAKVEQERPEIAKLLRDHAAREQNEDVSSQDE
ncbi:MAG: ankyrin repeat domain-containing protein [Planctomycetota bacterium]|nr:ankyrin repeat domain-containing protein [Planctomycetota bacterium]